MEFSYKLTEADYLAACRIPARRATGPWSTAVPYLYLVAIWIVVWGAIFLGMYLECTDLIGVSTEIHKLPATHIILVASIVPSVLYAGGLLVLGRSFLRMWYRKRRLKHFRSDPGCRAETTIHLSTDTVDFRSETGTSNSAWTCYQSWVERSGILLLVTKAEVRKIVKIAGLSEAQKTELRGILSAALPEH